MRETHFRKKGNIDGIFYFIKCKNVGMEFYSFSIKRPVCLFRSRRALFKKYISVKYKLFSEFDISKMKLKICQITLKLKAGKAKHYWVLSTNIWIQKVC